MVLCLRQKPHDAKIGLPAKKKYTAIVKYNRTNFHDTSVIACGVYKSLA
jgi:hypothetical protein